MKAFIRAVAVTGLAMSALALTTGPVNAADPPLCKAASGRNCIRVEISDAKSEVSSIRVDGGSCLILTNTSRGALNYYPNRSVTNDANVQPKVSTYKGNACQSNTGFTDPYLTYWSRWTDGHNYRMVGV